MRGSIEWRGRDVARITVSAGFDPVTGARRRVRATVRRESDETDAHLHERVELEQARLIRELETGMDLEPGRVTVAALFDRWLAHKGARGGVRPKTLRGYRDMVRLHVVPAIGTLPLRKVRPSHIDSVLDGMAGRGLAPRSITKCRNVMNGAFRQARRWKLIDVNPVEDTDAPRVGGAELEHVPAPELLAQVLEAARAKGGEFVVALVVFVATGLRRSEVVGLRWQDLDLDDGRVHVRQTLQRVPHDEGSRLEFLEPKSDRSKRTFRLPPLALEALRRHRRDQAERRLQLGEGWQDHDLVFPGWDGSPRDPDAFGHALRRVMADAGLDPRTRLHDLRHGFATALLAQGVHPAIVSAVLGHSSPAFTMSTYQHVLDGMTDTAADAIERALGTGSVPKVSPTADGEQRSPSP